MKRTVAIALALGLMVGAYAGSAEAAKKKKKKKKPVRVERTVSVPYQCPCGPSWGTDVPMVGPHVGFWLVGGAVGGGITPTGAQDKFVKVEVKDAAGQPVKVALGQNVDGTDNLAEVDLGTVCGTTGDDSLKVEAPGVQVDLFVFEGLCDDGKTQSIATSGTIELTFSNLP